MVDEVFKKFARDVARARPGATTVAEWLSAAPVAFDAHAEPVAGELVPVISRAATLENLELARQMLARAMDFGWGRESLPGRAGDMEKRHPLEHPTAVGHIQSAVTLLRKLLEDAHAHQR